MKTETRLIKFLQTGVRFLEQKLFFLKNNFALSLLNLFVGFLSGNLFGTFLPTLRWVVPWDGFIVFGLVVLFEFISYKVYQATTRSFLILWTNKLNIWRSSGPVPAPVAPVWKQLNYVKIGLLLGFFIDAFKVGS